MTFRLSVRLAFGIGVMRAAHRIVLGEHELRHTLAQRPQPLCPPHATSVGVQVQPSGIVGGCGGLDQRFQAGGEGFLRRVQFSQHAADQFLFQRRRAASLEIPAEFALRLEIIHGRARRAILQQPVGFRPLGPEAAIETFPDNIPIRLLRGQLELLGLGLSHLLTRGRHAFGPRRVPLVHRVRVGGLDIARKQTNKQNESSLHGAGSSCVADSRAGIRCCSMTGREPENKTCPQRFLAGGQVLARRDGKAFQARVSE